jgi:transposase
MSLQLRTAFEIPPETRRVALAAFPHGTLCLQLAESLGALYTDGRFADLFPRRGQPAEAPGRLAWVTVLQFIENLSDRAAADAVRSRLDWKYLLGLELTDPGFDHTVLSEFRTRLIKESGEQRLLDELLEQLRAQGLLKAGGGRQRTDSTHVLAAVRDLNRLERVGETLRAALTSLAVVVPEWLQQLAPPSWYERYSRRIENYHVPKTDEARHALAGTIGGDGQFLLKAIDAAPAQEWLGKIPAVQTLRRVWAEQYVERDDRLVWRAVNEMPAPAEMTSSPYDPEARYSTKRSIEWVGYKVHLTETCDAARPHLIVNVETTPATMPDDNMVAIVHASLAERHLLPSEHLVDKGYTSAQVLLESQREHQVSIVGPVADDPSWQARAGEGFGKAHFHVDWERHVVSCPAGKQSVSWLPKTTVPGVRVEARFSAKDCTPCAHRAHCTRAKKEPRIIGLPSRDLHEVLQQRREAQGSSAFRQQYADRAGIEGTHEQAIRRCGLRQCRYIGEAKTHLQHLVTAVAINLIRVGEWLAGTPLAPTRCSRFAALQAAR